MPRSQDTTRGGVHQSSHRLLRWSDDQRPFTRDFQDIFATLMVAIELKTHRVRLQKRYHSFTTLDAVQHLNNLKFIQTNTRPSPENPNIQVTTKLATTFAMLPQMARHLCNKFLAARFIESCERKSEFNTDDSVWQLTPKGIKLLESFAQRHAVQTPHVFNLLESSRNNMHLLVLDRDPDTDEVSMDHGTIEVIFRRFAGLEAQYVKSSSASSDSDSIQDIRDGISGIKLTSERKVGNRIHNDTFSGKQAIDWLMSCCTLVDEVEAQRIAAEFLKANFIELVQMEQPNPAGSVFPKSKYAWFRITADGQDVAQWSAKRREIGNNDSGKPGVATRDSNNTRLGAILGTPALCILFREFLVDTHCEENLRFHGEIRDFVSRWDALLKRTNGRPSMEHVRETLAGTYDIYNAYLAPGAPCELNIDYNLRSALINRMTPFDLPDAELTRTVDEIVRLYDQAQNSVFKLMASDSVPKFLRESKYQSTIRSHLKEYLAEVVPTQPIPVA